MIMRASFRMQGPMDDDQGGRLVGIPLKVNDTPMVFWDTENQQTQQRFLDSVDPGYFTYLVNQHIDELDGEGRMRAATAIRIAYSHALETLFAFIGAAIQAPEIPAAWLLKYTNTGLKELIESISTRQKVPNKVELKLFSWDEVALRLTPAGGDPAAVSDLQAASARLWRGLAAEFTDASFLDEYNSLKHGFRVGLGEWYFAVGREDSPGVPAPKERMHVMGASPFGSDFLRAVKVEQDGPHWQYEKQRVNWSPQVFAARMPLIVASLNNIITFLHMVNGRPPEDCGCRAFRQADVSEAMFDPDHSFSSRFAHRLIFDPARIPRTTKQEASEYYDEQVNGDGPDEQF